MGVIKDCDASIALDPGFVKAYLRKANVLKAMGQTQKAMDVYSKAMELDPNSDEAKNGYKDCAVRQYQGNRGGNPEEVRARAMNGSYWTSCDSSSRDFGSDNMSQD